MENCPYDVDTTKDESGRVWVTVTFRPPDKSEQAYGYGREGTLLLIESLRVALEVLEASESDI